MQVLEDELWLWALCGPHAAVSSGHRCISAVKTHVPDGVFPIVSSDSWSLHWHSVLAHTDSTVPPPLPVDVTVHVLSQYHMSRFLLDVLSRAGTLESRSKLMMC